MLDICVEAEDELFEKYDIKQGSTGLAEEKHLPLYDELMSREDVEFVAGGASQNTIRAVQWMTGIQGLTTFVGSVGNDKTAETLRTIAKNAGVNVNYYVTDKDRTGTCAVLIQDKERALMANISACNHYSLEHFESKEIQELVHKAKFYFTTGFFLTVPVGLEVLTKIADHANETNKTFVANLGAPFLFEIFWDRVLKLIEFSDYVICNHHEAEALIKVNGWEEGNIENAAKMVSELPKLNKSRSRTVIFTCGSEPTVVYQNGEILKFSTIKTDPKDIVDLNGAGDAFAGGFLAGLAKGVSLKECIDAGHNCAHHVILRSGPTFPETPEDRKSVV